MLLGTIVKRRPSALIRTFGVAAGRVVSAKSTESYINRARRIALWGALLAIAMPLQAYQSASTEEIKFDPTACKQNSGNMYVALGRYVFAMPDADQGKYIFGLPTQTNLFLQVPDPTSQPVASATRSNCSATE
jgi:hypothetical protein